MVKSNYVSRTSFPYDLQEVTTGQLPEKERLFNHESFFSSLDPDSFESAEDPDTRFLMWSDPDDNKVDPATPNSSKNMKKFFF